MTAGKHQLLGIVLAGSMAVMPLGGCESLPGEPGTQGAVIGGVAGGATGAAVAGEDNRLLGALIGAAVGGGGGYLVGSNMENADADEEDRREAQQAVEEARTDPATTQDVSGADTADLNNDGFVTLDEVIALSDAGLNDREILNRLTATGQVFELTPQQEQQLINAGVSRNVVEEMETLNTETREQLIRERSSDVISSDPDAQPRPGIQPRR